MLFGSDGTAAPRAVHEAREGETVLLRLGSQFPLQDAPGTRELVQRHHRLVQALVDDAVAGEVTRVEDVGVEATQLIAGLVFERSNLVEDEIFLNLMRLGDELPTNSELIGHMRTQATSYNRRLRTEFCRLLVALQKAFPDTDVRTFIKEAAIGRYIVHYADFESCVLRQISQINDIEPALVSKMKSLGSDGDQDVTREVRMTFTKLVRTGDLIVASLKRGRIEIDLDLGGTFTLGLELLKGLSYDVEFSDSWLLQCNLPQDIARQAQSQGASVFQIY